MVLRAVDGPVFLYEHRKHPRPYQFSVIRFNIVRPLTLEPRALQKAARLMSNVTYSGKVTAPSHRHGLRYNVVEVH